MAASAAMAGGNLVIEVIGVPRDQCRIICVVVKAAVKAAVTMALFVGVGIVCL